MQAYARDPYTWLYPEITPHHVGRLKVSDLHEIYYEVSGNPDGKPVVFLHGGPGSGTSGNQRRFFNPKKYRIVLFDQRGSGKSTPYACLEENTTWDLVEDMEKLRRELNISQWQVFGGSWGSTLALSYAETHPRVVTELVLRGIFLLRKKEIDWFYQYGASEVFPDSWEKFVEMIPVEERGDFLKAYHKRVTSEDRALQLKAAKAWSEWEGSASKLYPDAAFTAGYAADSFALSFARIECHYFINRAFMKTDGQLLKDLDRIRHIPTTIVQGRYDMCCPMDSAWTLHKAWPEAEFFLVPDEGHSAFEPGIARALVAATDKYSAI